MAETSGISWTDATFNAWIGCQAVSPACAHCYAEALVKRWGGDFTTRRRTSPANWLLPRRWNRKAAAEHRRTRVFCSSLADVFDNKVPPEWRADLWALIRETPALDWLLLTKRPMNIAGMLPSDWGDGWPNVWLGTTAEDQVELNRRWPHLATIPAAVRFLSCEPLLSPLVLPDARDNLHWVIVGGESGPGARPMPVSWATDVLGQAAGIGAAAFFKQAGSARGPDWPATVTGKGDAPEQWPAHLWLQEFPR